MSKDILWTPCGPPADPLWTLSHLQHEAPPSRPLVVDLRLGGGEGGGVLHHAVHLPPVHARVAFGVLRPVRLPVGAAAVVLRWGGGPVRDAAARAEQTSNYMYIRALMCVCDIKRGIR
eukprot:1182920-Prorocentrum_minimum.AAC.2